MDDTECHPLTLTRKIPAYPVGNMPLSEHQDRAMRGTEGQAVAHHPHAWLDAGEVAGFCASDGGVLVGAGDEPLVWKGEAPDGVRVTAEKSFLIRYPWDFIRATECHVGGLKENRIEGEVHELAVVEGVIEVGEGTRILPGVFIEGNVVIGRNCKIGPNCYIRGNTSIGDKCHIGQSVEVKNSLILSGTNVGHLSYVGDSVLGEGVNFGAGTTTSNLRHDGKNHFVVVNRERIDTGRRKFGAIVGDGVHTGINTSIYPARMLWAGVSTLPAEVVRKDIRETGKR